MRPCDRYLLSKNSSILCVSVQTGRAQPPPHEREGFLPLVLFLFVFDAMEERGSLSLHFRQDRKGAMGFALIEHGAIHAAARTIPDIE